MEVQDIHNRYELKELELNSLLEVTQAINENLPEESLYKIYEFILRANMNLKKLALFVYDEKWKCKVNFGTRKEYQDDDFEDKLLVIDKLTKVNTLPGGTIFDQFDFAMPIKHKKTKLAFIFFEHAEEEREVNAKFIEALSNILIVAIENKKLTRKEIAQEAFRKEMEIASTVQQFLFPKSLPYLENLKVHASYLPHHNVGGDYYDFLNLSDDSFLFCIADVSGKGMPAAILMSNFQASLHTIIRRSTDLKVIISELNYQILQNANGESFITFFVAIYDKKERRLRYVNAGHNPPYFKNKTLGKWETLNEGTTVLGAFEELPFLSEGSIDNLDEFILFSYTDGVTETNNRAEEEFGTDRLEFEIDRNADFGLRRLHEGLLRGLDAFKEEGEYIDDITMLSCEVSV